MCCVSSTTPIINHESIEGFSGFLSELDQSQQLCLRVDRAGRLQLGQSEGFCGARTVADRLSDYLGAHEHFVDERLSEEAQSGLRALMHYPGLDLLNFNPELAQRLNRRLSTLFIERLGCDAIAIQSAELDEAIHLLEAQVVNEEQTQVSRQARARWPADDEQLELQLKDGTLSVDATPWSVLPTVAVDWSQYSFASVKLYNAYLRQELASCTLDEAMVAQLRALATDLNDGLLLDALDKASNLTVTLPDINYFSPDYYLDRETTALILRGCAQKLDKIAAARWSSASVAAERSMLESAQVILKQTIDLRSNPDIKPRWEALERLWNEAVARQSSVILVPPDSSLHWLRNAPESGDLTIALQDKEFKVHSIFYPEGVTTDLSNYDWLSAACMLEAMYGQRRMICTGSFRIACEIGAFELAQELYEYSSGDMENSTTARLAQLAQIPAEIDAHRHYATLAPHFSLLAELPQLVQCVPTEHLVRLAKRTDLRACEQTVWEVLRSRARESPSERERLLDCIQWEHCTKEWVCETFIHGDDWDLISIKEAKNLELRAQAESIVLRNPGFERDFIGYLPEGEVCYISRSFEDGAQVNFTLSRQPGESRLELQAFGRRWTQPFTARLGSNRFVIQWIYFVEDPQYETFELSLEHYPSEAADCSYVEGSINRCTSRRIARDELGLHLLEGIALVFD